MKLLNLFKKKPAQPCIRLVINDEIKIMTNRLLYTTKAYQFKKESGRDYSQERNEGMKLIGIIEGLKREMRNG